LSSAAPSTLALTWGSIDDSLIHVGRSVSDGQLKATKTDRPRDVDLDPNLAQDLREYRMSQGRPSEREHLFTMEDGRLWNEGKWRRWRDRIFDPAVKRAGPDPIRPYELRHVRASLLLMSEASIVEVAAQMGHQPSVCLNVYGHLVAGLKGRGKIDPTSEITSARRASIDPNVGDFTASS
jgi:integrase